MNFLFNLSLSNLSLARANEESGHAGNQLIWKKGILLPTRALVSLGTLSVEQAGMHLTRKKWNILNQFERVCQEMFRKPKFKITWISHGSIFIGCVLRHKFLHIYGWYIESFSSTSFDSLSWVVKIKYSEHYEYIHVVFLAPLCEIVFEKLCLILFEKFVDVLKLIKE